MKRAEAINVLREISRLCGDHIPIDSISLTPFKTSYHPFSETPEQRYKVLLQTSLDLLSETDIQSFLENKGLRMIGCSDRLVVIYRPEDEKNKLSR